MRNLNSLKVINHGRLLSQRLSGYCITRSEASGFCQSHASRGRRFVTQLQSASKPPWRILFFGSDEFAVESLKRLHASRDDTKAGYKCIDSIEVVTLTGDAPVRKYAEQHRLPLHQWPDVDLSSGFDVGVVVSFGCLIKENLINKMAYGILNVHPSLLPRWRGPAPIFHTILHGDSVTGVTVMQIRPKRFDVGPILHQELCKVPKNCTADELGATLAVVGARLLMDTLAHLPERIANQKEQSKEGATFAPKISPRMAWIIWEDYSCDHIDRLFHAIGSRFPLKTMWMGNPVKLLDFIGKCNVMFPAAPYLTAVPGSVLYQKESSALLVRCKDGWVGFRSVKFKKKLSAADFFNGYLHQSVLKKSPSLDTCLFQSYKERTNLPGGQDNSMLLQNKTSF
ncbi:methionyl-tRNA formyltransferase, mitochondrial isoform X1 [Triplophysa dalaica]|uniref:methionyl-tRNA formyltransferase, mitochondrial isoform X1 n=1 Tax=Triplophysa dalaica TaxID=1582913 RepID=UPI0024DFE6AE|nr:methionyl-tRNA formyltransferase, mitochondrial isoform X1 [Triplophysa dalaica]